MLPGKIKLVRHDGSLALVVENSDDDNPLLCLFDDESDLSEEQVKDFFKAVVKLWNDQF